VFAVFFAFRFLGVHSLGDVRGLGGEVVVDENLIGVENVVAIHVADAADRIANDLLNVDDRADGLLADFRDGDFTAHADHVAFHEGLASHTALGIEREAGVEDGIGNGIRDLVWMTFTNGFGGKNVVAHVFFDFRIVKS
jgi:hypothetical protein